MTDEATYLRLLREDPENEKVREEYFAWLADRSDHRAEYVQLMNKRLSLQRELEHIDAQIRFFSPIKNEWLDIVFPLRIRSPSVGRVFLQPRPDSPLYVTTGTTVVPGKVVCLVEVEKTYNEVIASEHGIVDQIAVADGDMVEFNQVLFRLKRYEPLDSW